MPEYRIEISPNNRAGCKDTVCKKEAVKIVKGELRFGSWVEIKEHGSWAWKHWGCVSGAQLQNVRDLCEKSDGSYDFDAMDGYDELSAQPELQAKFRRCVEQGFIDPEDFKGDPEKNKLGEKGIHLTAAQKKKKEEAAAAADEDSPPKKKAKRGRKADEDDDEEEKPAPKKGRRAKQAESDDAKRAPIKAAPKKSKKPVKEESEEEEEEEEEVEEPAPVKKGRKAAPAKAKAPAKTGRKAAAKKAPVEDEDEDDDEEEEEKPAPKAKGKRGRPRRS